MSKSKRSMQRGTPLPPGGNGNLPPMQVPVLGQKFEPKPDPWNQDEIDLLRSAQAINDYVLLEVPKETKTAGGIALSEGAEVKKVQLGKVLSVGPGALDNNGVFVETTLKPGDTTYLFFIGAPLNPGFVDVGESYIVMFRERQLGGVVRERNNA